MTSGGSEPAHQLHYDLPPAALADLISTFYEFRSGGPRFDEVERADRAQIRFQFSGEGCYIFGDGHCDKAALVTIVGPTDAPVRSQAAGTLHIFGAGLTPAGWVAMMGNQADRFVNRAVDASLLFGDKVNALWMRLGAAADLADRIAIASAFIQEMLRDLDAPPVAFIHSVDRWLTENVDPKVADLQEETGLSPRQLERMTKRCYGVPPKKLAAKYRALRAAAALARGDEEADLLVDAFYDQSHLIREVKRFTGLTPTQLREGASPLTSMTQEGRHALAGQVTPLISHS